MYLRGEIHRWTQLDRQPPRTRALASHSWILSRLSANCDRWLERTPSPYHYSNYWSRESSGERKRRGWWRVGVFQFIANSLVSSSNDGRRNGTRDHLRRVFCPRAGISDSTLYRLLFSGDRFKQRTMIFGDGHVQDSCRRKFSELYKDNIYSLILYKIDKRNIYIYIYPLVTLFIKI